MNNVNIYLSIYIYTHYAKEGFDFFYMRVR